MRKHFSMKKRFMALLLSSAMAASVFTGASYKTKADTTEQETVNLDQYANGDLTDTDATAEELIAESEYAVTEEAFNEAIADDVEEYQENLDLPTTDAAGNYPSSVDLSATKYFPAIGNQSYIGSCTSFAEVYYAFTYERCKALDIEATSDNVMSPAFIYNKIKVSNGGSNAAYAMDRLKEIGTPAMSSADFESYTYENMCKTWFPEKSIWEEASHNRLSNYTFFDISGDISSPTDEDLNTIKEYLNNGYVITFTTNTRNWKYKTLPSGSAHSGESMVASSASASSSHRMTIVGYDDNIYCDLNGNGTIETGERGAFKTANSWGDDWGNNGYIWISYDSLNSTSSVGVNNSNRVPSMYSLAVRSFESEDKASDVNMVLTLNTARRNQLRIYVYQYNSNGNFVNSASFLTTNTRNYLPYALNGSEDASSGTITYDLNNVFTSITKDNVKDYTWKVAISDNSSDSYPIVLENAYIEAGDNVLYDITPDNAQINGNSKTYSFQEASFRGNGFTVSNNAPTILDRVTLTASAYGGSGNYTYTYGAIHNGKTLVFPYCENTTNSSVSVSLAYPSEDAYAGSCELVGNNTLYVDITDTETNQTIRQTIDNYYVAGLNIESLTATTASGKYKVNEKVNLTAVVVNEAMYRYNSRTFTIKHNGTTSTIPIYSSSTEYTASFTPDEAGTYEISFSVSDYLGQSDTETITINVADESNTVTVYYKNNSWSNANIHYCVNNGSWTNVPGVTMSASDISGYTWKYVIDLGEQSGAQVCFNNGNNWWDSRNGANYYVTTGTYGISNGNVTELDLEFTADVTVDKAVGGKYNTTKISVATANGTPATYTYYIYPAGSTKSVGYGTTNSTYNFYNWTPYTAGTYTIEVEVTDTNGNVATDVINNYVVEGEMFDYFTTSVASPQNVNTAITLSASFKNFQPDPYNSYSFTVNNGTTTKSLDTSVSNNVATATWTPTEAGTYTLTAIFRSFNGVTTSTSIQYVVKNSNTVTVYYNNSSWSNANIHYCVNNGSWTNVPGVAMKSSNRNGYKWMYTIDLGTQSGAQVCFNNGNNWWDSRNGANYYVTAGTYGISNGNVTSLS